MKSNKPDAGDGKQPRLIRDVRGVAPGRQPVIHASGNHQTQARAVPLQKQPDCRAVASTDPLEELFGIGTLRSRHLPSPQDLAPREAQILDSHSEEI
jgi:hypothetical protein